MNVFLVAVVTAGVLQPCMWLPAEGNVPVAAIFAFLYGFFGLGGLSVSNSVIATHLDPNKFASLCGVFFTSEIAVSRLCGIDLARGGVTERSCLLKGFLGGAPLSGFILARTKDKVTIASSGRSLPIRDPLTRPEQRLKRIGHFPGGIMIFGILFSFYARYMSECQSGVEGERATGPAAAEPVSGAVSESRQRFSLRSDVT